MTRTKVIASAEGGTVVELSDAENKYFDDEEKRGIDAQPMENWKSSMQETDAGMPRYLEDHIKDDHDGVASNEFLQTKYDDKKALRATKP